MDFRIVKKFETSFMGGTIDTGYRIEYGGKRLDVERYVYPDRSFYGRYFVRLEKNPETRRYQWLEVEPVE
jgi:hypothetical protein